MMKENADCDIHIVLSVDCAWEDLSALLREGLRGEGEVVWAGK